MTDNAFDYLAYTEDLSPPPSPPKAISPINFNEPFDWELPFPPLSPPTQYTDVPMVQSPTPSPTDELTQLINLPMGPLNQEDRDALDNWATQIAAQETPRLQDGFPSLDDIVPLGSIGDDSSETSTPTMDKTPPQSMPTSPAATTTHSSRSTHSTAPIIIPKIKKNKSLRCLQNQTRKC